MSDAVTAETLAAAITTAFTAQHATKTVKIPFEDLKVQQFTAQKDLLDIKYRPQYRAYRQQMAMDFMRYKRWNILVKQGLEHDPKLELVQVDGIGRYMPETVTTASVQIPADDTSDEDLYFYFFNTIHPQGHWARILHKVRSDKLPMLYFIDRLDKMLPP